MILFLKFIVSSMLSNTSNGVYGQLNVGAGQTLIVIKAQVYSFSVFSG